MAAPTPKGANRSGQRDQCGTPIIGATVSSESGVFARAFGGGPLQGQKLVRFIFLDEGGISKREPWVVVAGVFVHGDNQVVALDERLAFLVKKHIPEELRDGFVFHATELWSGIGPIFKDRDRWSLPVRLNILHDLVRIPGQYEIPIVFFALERSRVVFDEVDMTKVSAHELLAAAHGMTFTGCTLRIEQHMLEVWPSEIAQLVAEDNDQARSIIKRAHEVIRNPKWIEQNNFEGLGSLLPLKKIRGAVHFANKVESSLTRSTMVWVTAISTARFA